MVGVWLYTHDGRTMYYVAVQLPMPKSVSYNGQIFDWSVDDKRYVRRDVYLSHDLTDNDAYKAHEATLFQELRMATEKDYPKV